MSALSTFAIVRGMAEALPAHPKDDDSSDLASSYEAIALLVHAYFAALSFKLLGFDEDKPLAECEELAPQLPPKWNSGFGSLSFVYSHKQSTMRFVIRVDRMGAKVEVRGLAVKDDNIHRFERATREVVDSKALPVRITFAENGSEDRAALADKLRKVFVSEEAISGILHDLKVNIIQKLIPKLQQEGYVETLEAEANANAERRRQEVQHPYHPYYQPTPANNPYTFPQPLPEMAHPRPQPRPPVPMGDFPPPGFEDEYEMNRPPPGGVYFPGGHQPFGGIGHDDLIPPGLGPHDPLRGSFVPGGGMAGRGGHSGMHPGPMDPLFTGQGGVGGDPSGYDPQAPPGARWDPIGPGGGPRFPGPGSGRGNNPFGGYGSGSFM